MSPLSRTPDSYYFICAGITTMLDKTENSMTSSIAQGSIHYIMHMSHPAPRLAFLGRSRRCIFPDIFTVLPVVKRASELASTFSLLVFFGFHSHPSLTIAGRQTLTNLS